MTTYDPKYVQGFLAGLLAAGRLAEAEAAAVELANLEGIQEHPDMPFSAPIEELEFILRVYNILKREHVHTVGDLLKKTRAQLRAMHLMNKEGVESIAFKLTPYYTLGEDAWSSVV